LYGLRPRVRVRSRWARVQASHLRAGVSMRFGHPGVEQTRQLMCASQSLCPLACLGVLGLHIYSYCVTIDMSAKERR
jgi:hypothetical protein